MKMEAKVTRASFIVLLILGTILAQTHVEAKSCCRNTTARNCYNVCRFAGTSRERCAKVCDCKIIDGTKCPSDYPKFYCMLGCSSSQCSTISTLNNSDADEEAVRCKNACSDLCNEGSSHEVYDA